MHNRPADTAGTGKVAIVSTEGLSAQSKVNDCVGSNPTTGPLTSTVGALLCPSIAESEALLLDGQSTATSHNRRGLVAPLLAAAQKVGQGYTDGKGS